MANPSLTRVRRALMLINRIDTFRKYRALPMRPKFQGMALGVIAMALVKHDRALNGGLRRGT